MAVVHAGDTGSSEDCFDPTMAEELNDGHGADLLLDPDLAAAIQLERDFQLAAQLMYQAEHDANFAKRLSQVAEEEWMENGNIMESAFDPMQCSSVAGIQFEAGDCGICLEHKGFKLAGECNHSFCVSCLTQYLSGKLAQKTGAPFKCPSPECPQELSQDLIAKLMSPEDVQEYKQLCAEAAMKNRVYCPSPDCARAQDIPPECGPKVSCCYCSLDFCLTCKVSWHVGSTCEEYQNNEQDRTVQDIAKSKNWKACPSCGHMISKTEDSCNWVRCHCSCEFCFKCLIKYIDARPQPDNVHGKAGCDCPLFDFFDEEDNMEEEEEVYQDEDVDLDSQYSDYSEVSSFDQPPPHGPPPDLFDEPPPFEGIPWKAAKGKGKGKQKKKQIPYKERRVARGIRLPRPGRPAFQKIPQWLQTCIHKQQCMYCAWSFQSIEKLQYHLNCTSDHDVYTCCGRVFLNKDGLKSHEWCCHGPGGRNKHKDAASDTGHGGLARCLEQANYYSPRLEVTTKLVSDDEGTWNSKWSTHDSWYSCGWHDWTEDDNEDNNRVGSAYVDTTGINLSASSSQNTPDAEASCKIGDHAQAAVASSFSEDPLQKCDPWSAAPLPERPDAELLPRWHQGHHKVEDYPITAPASSSFQNPLQQADPFWEMCNDPTAADSDPWQPPHNKGASLDAAVASAKLQVASSPQALVEKTLTEVERATEKTLAELGRATENTLAELGCASANLERRCNWQEAAKLQLASSPQSSPEALAQQLATLRKERTGQGREVDMSKFQIYLALGNHDASGYGEEYISLQCGEQLFMQEDAESRLKLNQGWAYGFAPRQGQFGWLPPSLVSRFIFQEYSALFAWDAVEYGSGYICLQQGEQLLVQEDSEGQPSQDEGWGFGYSKRQGRYGWLPAKYVNVRFIEV